MRRSRLNCGIAALVALGFWVTAGESADLSLTGGSITITVATATAGSQPNASGNSTCGLQWTTGVADPTQKITVRTNLSDPAFSLTVEAQSVTNGAAAGLAPLSTTDTDVITDITADVSGSGQLYYEAAATVAQGSGSESHTITYTITAQ